MYDLSTLGWDESFQIHFETIADSTLRPARVAVVERGRLQLLGLGRPCWATVGGRLLNQASDPLALPAVGDWVAVRPGQEMATIHHVLPRRSQFVRKVAGRRSAPQVVCANVDRVFIVTAVGEDFSPRRLERYQAAVWEGGAEPIVVLNKTDRVADLSPILYEIAAVAPGTPVARVSALAEDGLAELRSFLRPGVTIALVGSSGVGKSTIINRLLGRQRQATAAVRAGDGRGRHTTTRRELLLTAAGEIVIDTPGMRELALWDAGEGLEATFPEVEALAGRCRFADCRHQGEPGCAVAAAVERGELPPERMASYHRLQREMAYQARRAEEREAFDSKKRWKQIHKEKRRLQKLNRRLGLK